MTRFRRRLGTILIVVGVLALAYGATIYFWKDPVTAVYASWKQHQLDGQLEEEFASYRGDVQAEAAEIAAAATTAAPAVTTTATATTPASPDASAEETSEPVAEVEEEPDLGAIVHRAAERFARKIKPGQPLGRLIIPKLGIDPVFVNGTEWGRDLSRGPGRYPETSVPGLGRLTAIAAHRTTFGAWFRNIDDLKRGDPITVELPYGTFHYVVTGHEIVDDEDWSIIKPRSYETLVLSACHPLYSAKQRWIVYARLVKVDLPGGETYKVGDSPQLAAPASG